MQDTPAQGVEAAVASSAEPPPPTEETSAPDARVLEALAPGDAGAISKKKKKKLKLGMKIEHQTAGRVRMKVAAGKGNPALLQQIGETFAGIPGIERVNVNPTTGSLVLHYDRKQHETVHQHLRSHYETQGSPAPPPTQLDELASKIEREAEFLAEHSHAARMVVHVCKRLDREIKLRTHNLFDLKIGLACTVMALPIIELGASAATPVWLTLGVFTLNHFVELQRHHDLEEKVDRQDHDLEEKVDRQAPVVVKGDKDKSPQPSV